MGAKGWHQGVTKRGKKAVEIRNQLTSKELQAHPKKPAELTALIVNLPVAVVWRPRTGRMSLSARGNQSSAFPARGKNGRLDPFAPLG